MKDFRENSLYFEKMRHKYVFFYLPVSLFGVLFGLFVVSLKADYSKLGHILIILGAFSLFLDLVFMKLLKKREDQLKVREYREKNFR